MERAAQRGRRTGGLGAGRRLEPPQVDGYLAAKRLGDDGGGHVADPRQVSQRTAARAVGKLGRGQLGGQVRGTAESAHPVGGLVRPFEQESDLTQRLNRFHPMTVARISARSTG